MFIGWRLGGKGIDGRGMWGYWGREEGNSIQDSHLPQRLAAGIDPGCAICRCPCVELTNVGAPLGGWGHAPWGKLKILVWSEASDFERKVKVVHKRGEWWRNVYHFTVDPSWLCRGKWLTDSLWLKNKLFYMFVTSGNLRRIDLFSPWYFQARKVPHDAVQQWGNEVDPRSVWIRRCKIFHIVVWQRI